MSILGVLPGHASLLHVAPSTHAACTAICTAPASLCKRPARHAAGLVSYQLRGACFIMQVQTQIGPTQKSIAPHNLYDGSGGTSPAVAARSSMHYSALGCRLMCRRNEFGRMLLGKYYFAGGCLPKLMLCICRSLAVSLPPRPRNRETQFFATRRDRCADRLAAFLAS